MKFIFLTGGLIGFVTAVVAGWSADRAADAILLDGMIGCLVGAVLFRWLWSVVLRGMRETVVARQRAAEAAAEAKKKA
jgi:hypothetical protein